MSELPPPSFPPPSVEPVEPVELADPVPVTERPDARGWRNPTRATILVVLGSVLALVVAGFVFIVRNEPSDSDDGTVSFELRWDERAPALAGIDDVDPIRTLGAYDDVVVFSAADTDADAALVVGVDRGTGDQRWDVRLPEAIGGGAVGRIVDDQLFVVAGAGDPDDDTVVPGAMRLTVLDPRNGDELWSHDGLDAAFSWIVVGDQVLAATGAFGGGGRTLVALDRRDGRERWDRPIAGSSMPVVVRSDGFVVVDGSGRDATYVGLDLDGEERWSIEAEASISGADWYPDAAGGVVALVDGDSLIGVDLDTGDEQWSVDRPEIGEPSEVQLTPRPELGIVMSCAAGSDDSGTDVVAVAAFDLDDGEALWNRELSGEEAAFVGVIGDHVFTTETSQFGDGCLSYLNLALARDLEVTDARTGEPAWSIEADDELQGVTMGRRSGSFTTPFDTLIVTRGRTDEVIDLDSGEVLGSIDREDVDDGRRVAGQPANWGDVVVYVEADRDDEEQFTSTVRDANDDEHAVDLDGLAQVIGFVNGVLYVRSGSHLVAID